MKFKTGDVIWTNYPKAPNYKFEFEVCIVTAHTTNFYEILMVNCNADDERSETPYSTEVDVKYIEGVFVHVPENLKKLVKLLYC